MDSVGDGEEFTQHHIKVKSEDVSRYRIIPGDHEREEDRFQAGGTEAGIGDQGTGSTEVLSWVPRLPCAQLGWEDPR